MRLDQLKGLDRQTAADALIDHARHMRWLIRWIQRELKRPKRQRRWQSGPEAIRDILAYGSTVSEVAPGIPWVIVMIL